jgi:hypothetical protein
MVSGLSQKASEQAQVLRTHLTPRAHHRRRGETYPTAGFRRKVGSPYPSAPRGGESEPQGEPRGRRGGKGLERDGGRWRVTNAPPQPARKRADFRWVLAHERVGEGRKPQEFVDKGAAARRAGASLRQPIAWRQISWRPAPRHGRRVPRRIVPGEPQRKNRKVRALQRMLACWFRGRAVAVKRVTTNRQGWQVAKPPRSDS